MISLHINLVNGTGADINLALKLCQYDGRLDAHNIQKLIRRLGPDDGRALDVLAAGKLLMAKASSKTSARWIASAFAL